MQLSADRTTGPAAKGPVTAALGLLAAGLLGALPASAQAQDTGGGAGSDSPQHFSNAYDATASEAGTLVLDAALLNYQEDEGRVHALEAGFGATWSSADGIVASGRFTYDSLTGATPNGALRSRYEQVFVPPRKTRFLPGRLDTISGSSGRYTTPPNRLPVDKGFKDHREAVDLNVTLPASSTLRLSLGGSASYETDYTSFSARTSVAKDLNRKNTTLSLGFEYERDGSHPYVGIPRALSTMGDMIVGTNGIKHVFSAVAGITQVLTPNWLVQLNYSYGRSRGYHTDPYKIVSLIDSSSGDPFYYLYEKRPDHRERNSIYAGTKLALGSAVTDLSVRWYRDSWGINSMTYALSEHAPLGRSAYLEPELRFYRQTAARFFREYLLLDEPTPAYVSADSRLGRFHAWTFGLKGGAHLSDHLEFYAAAERYIQEGRDFDRRAPGQLARTELFAGSRSVSLISGLRYTFK